MWEQSKEKVVWPWYLPALLLCRFCETEEKQRKVCFFQVGCVCLSVSLAGRVRLCICSWVTHRACLYQRILTRWVGVDCRLVYFRPAGFVQGGHEAVSFFQGSFIDFNIRRLKILHKLSWNIWLDCDQFITSSVTSILHLWKYNSYI